MRLHGVYNLQWDNLHSEQLIESRSQELLGMLSNYVDSYRCSLVVYYSSVHSYNGTCSRQRSVPILNLLYMSIGMRWKIYLLHYYANGLLYSLVCLQDLYPERMTGTSCKQKLTRSLFKLIVESTLYVVWNILCHSVEREGPPAAVMIWYMTWSKLSLRTVSELSYIEG